MLLMATLSSGEIGFGNASTKNGPRGGFTNGVTDHKNAACGQRK